MLLPGSVLFILWAASGKMVAALSNTCSSPTLMKYVSLSGYAPIHVFCSQQYPNATSTPVTQTCHQSSRARTRRDNRHGGWGGHRGFGGEHSGEQGGSEPNEALFMTLIHEDDTTISTFCSCNANPNFHIQTVSCAAGEYCDSTGACKMQRDCQNPARCDVSSFCGTGSAGDPLFCHQDADDTTTGYCMNDGPPDASCPEPDEYEDCTSNVECGEQRVCIYSCCREEPFCIDVAMYRSTV